MFIFKKIPTSSTAALSVLQIGCSSKEHFVKVMCLIIRTWRVFSNSISMIKRRALWWRKRLYWEASPNTHYRRMYVFSVSPTNTHICNHRVFQEVNRVVSKILPCPRQRSRPWTSAIRAQSGCAAHCPGTVTDLVQEVRHWLRPLAFWLVDESCHEWGTMTDWHTQVRSVQLMFYFVSFQKQGT